MDDAQRESPEASVPGSENSGDEFAPQVYEELRRLAEIMFRGEPGGHTLQPTAVVHEAWLRIQNSSIEFDDKAHYYALAARAMRRMLVDHARGRRAEKRGQAADRITLDAELVVAPTPEVDVLVLDAALTKLAELFGRQARVAELRLLTGLEIEEIATLLDVSGITVRRDWRFARAWLQKELGGHSSA